MSATATAPVNGSKSAPTASSKLDLSTRDRILVAMDAKQITLEEASKALAALEKPAGVLRFKVSEKGAVSVMGINSSWPVTLYADQWERIIDNLEALQAFIKDNNAKLKRKG